jgi:hypothetical protein
MGYSVKIEESIDTLTRRWKGLEKKKMFGGISRPSPPPCRQNEGPT